MAELKASATDERVSPLTVLYDLLKNYFFAIVGAAFVALLLRVYVVEAFRIPTDFMAPRLIAGDYIFVYKLAYGGLVFGEATSPEPGDVVILSFPNDPTKDYIKRVVAVGGDTIEIRAGEIFINGKSRSRKLEPDVFEEDIGNHKYQALWGGSSPESRKLMPIKVPTGQIFVLGDNRTKGQDSRSWGFLPLSHVKGRASMIWFSVGDGVRWSRLFTRVN